jgi:shikimate kinase
MNISITGPRSVGKTTISKLVARKLKLNYISSDELGEKAFKKEGGLDKVIKSGKIKEIINSGGYKLILEIYRKNKNFVFDLSAGAFTSRSMGEASKEIRKLSKEKSIVIGLLPYKSRIKSTFILFNRERKRYHFKDSNKFKLLIRTLRKFIHVKKILLENSSFVIYTKKKNPQEISEEIFKKIKSF